MLRFRPILMTTMAALLGALPLALGTGTGYELRRPLGITIVGGLILSQLLTLYTTPVVYLAFDRLRLRMRESGTTSLIAGPGHPPAPRTNRNSAPAGAPGYQELACARNEAGDAMRSAVREIWTLLLVRDAEY